MGAHGVRLAAEFEMTTLFSPPGVSGSSALKHRIKRGNRNYAEAPSLRLHLVRSAAVTAGGL